MLGMSFPHATIGELLEEFLDLIQAGHHQERFDGFHRLDYRCGADRRIDGIRFLMFTRESRRA